MKTRRSILLILFACLVALAKGSMATPVSVLSYSYITNPSALYPDSSYSKLTDGIDVVPVWPSGSPDVNAMVGWQLVNPSISFVFSNKVNIAAIKVWVADSDGASAVTLPTQITVSTAEGYNRTFAITNPPGSGSTVELTLGGIYTNSDRFVISATRGSEWTMLSEVKFYEVQTTITNLVVAQRPGTKLVDLSYDLLGEININVPISLSISNNGIPVSANGLLGDVGPNVMPGTGKAIVWNAGDNWNGNASNLTFVVRNAMATQFVTSATQLVDSRDYTLTVASDHGSPVPSVGVHSNYCWKSAITASVMSVAGYSLVSWSGTGSIPASGSSNSTGAIVLTNSYSSITWNWMTNTYHMAFEPQDGISDGSTTKIVTFNEKFGALPSAHRNWYDFAGWWTDPSGGILVTNGTIVNDATLKFTHGYSYIANPSVLYQDTNYSKLTDGVAVVPAWPSVSPAVTAMVGWLNVDPHISFALSSPINVSEIKIWAADSDGASGVALPTQITVSTAEGYNQSFVITNPAGGGSTVEISLKGINTVSDRFIISATRGDQWTMFSEVQIYGTPDPQFADTTLYAHWTLVTQMIAGVVSGGIEIPGKIRAVAMRSPLDSYMKSTNNILYSAVVSNNAFGIKGVPVLSDYWVKAFIDLNNDGVWSPLEPIGSSLENPIYLTNDFMGVNISLGYGDWDEDGIPDNEEAFVLLTSASNALSPIQVDDDGPSDSGPGDPSISDPLANGTRYHPYDSIQKGINAATNGMTVLVMDGYYTSTGNRDIQLNGKRITVRSRNGADHVQVEDFTRGFICNSNETTNTVIQGFSIHTWSSYFGLEGIRCDGASPAIRDCNIWDCGIAGILCTNGAKPVIERCVVNGNAGGVRIFGSSPTFERCTIVSNNSDLGAGIYISGSSKPTIQNCLIANNASSVEGGGIYIGSGSSPTNINCTIAGNSAVTRGGGVSSGGSPVFYNDIIYNNTAPASTGIYASAAMTVQYSCLQSFYPGLGNKTNNPNLNTGDGYKLTAGSVAIDAGTVAFMPAVDLLGVPRPVDGDINGTATVDMGCYEFIPAGLDTDTDGVPDWWTWQYFGHLAGQGSDYSVGTNILPGSSMSTYEKYLADLNPTNPASVLEVTGVQWLPQGIKVDWQGGQWARQYLESRQDLANTNESWMPVFTNLPPTASATNVTVNVGTTNKAGFYRIRVER